MFCTVVDFCTFWLKNNSKKEDHMVFKNIRKMSKRLTALTKSYIFDLFDTISTIAFIYNFKVV